MSSDGDDDVQKHLPSDDAGTDRGDVSGAPDNEDDPHAPVADRDASSASDFGNGNNDDVEEEESGVDEDDEYDEYDDVSKSDEDDLEVEDHEVRIEDTVSGAAILLRQVNDYAGPIADAIIPCKWLFVNLGTPPTSWNDLGRYRRDFPGHFRTFVDELERCRRVRTIDMQHANFGEEGGTQWDADDGGPPNRIQPDEAFRVDAGLLPRADDLDRLFGTVLPNHSSLKNITIRESQIHPRCVQLFADSVANNPAFRMTMLSFESTPLTAECGRLLKSMLQRNVRLRDLRLWHCGLDAEGLELVCEGVGANEHIECLNVIDKVDVPAGAVVAAVAALTSNLVQCIVKVNSWSPEAFVELIQALWVNVTLKHVYLGQAGKFPDAHLVLDLLHTYNFTLPSIRLDPQWLGPNVSRHHACQDEVPIGALQLRNERVRIVGHELEIADYHVPCRPLWPLALHEISRFPTLLYRFVRNGNLTDLALQLEHNSNQKKRRRHQLALTDS